MKAIRVREHGGPEVLVVEEVEDPRPAAGQVLGVYVEHYNRERPHRGLDLATPIDPRSQAGMVCSRGPVERRDLLGGLIHEYSRAAA